MNFHTPARIDKHEHHHKEITPSHGYRDLVEELPPPSIPGCSDPLYAIVSAGVISSSVPCTPCMLTVFGVYL